MATASFSLMILVAGPYRAGTNDNRLAALPASIGDLASLEKLDLRWNKLAAAPAWLQELEARGCSIYK